MMRFRVVQQELYVTVGNSDLHLLQLFAEKSGVDSFIFSEDLSSQYIGPPEQKKKHSISFLPWVGRFAT